MTNPLHFAWWLTVPGSDERLVQAFAIGASLLAKVEAFAGSRRFAPYVSSQPSPSMPPVIWWPNNGAVYTLRVTFQDGSVVELPPLDMKARAWTEASPLSPPPAEHRSHVLYRGIHIQKPLVATTPWGKAEFDLWVDRCPLSGGGLDQIDNWFPGWRRVYVTDCTFDTCMSGPQGSNVELVRDTMIEKLGGDALSDARIVWNASIVDHVKGRADLHPDTYQFRSRGPKEEPKLLAGIRDQSKGSQGIFADRSTFVRNAAIVKCKIGTDGVGASLSLEKGVSNLLIENCTFDVGPTFITPSRSNVVIRNTPGVV